MKHDGNPPQTRVEKDAFKTQILSMKKKFDEENFDEAAAQAYRAWTKSVVNRIFIFPSFSVLYLINFPIDT